MAAGPIAERNQDATVYCGGLDEKVTDPILWELMLQAGPVVNVHMPKDRISQSHQGFGFVEFLGEEDADYAIKILNMIKLFGKPIRVNKASAHQKNIDIGANLFIGNLDPEVDEKLLYDTFSAFGVILQTPKIMRDPETGNSKGFAFISFASFEASDTAMEAMNGQYLSNRAITISYAFKKDSKGERHGSAAERLLAAQNPLSQSDLPHQFFSDAPPVVLPAMNAPPPPPTPGMPPINMPPPPMLPIPGMPPSIGGPVPPMGLPPPPMPPSFMPYGPPRGMPPPHPQTDQQNADGFMQRHPPPMQNQDNQGPPQNTGPQQNMGPPGMPPQGHPGMGPPGMGPPSMRGPPGMGPPRFQGMGGPPGPPGMGPPGMRGPPGPPGMMGHPGMGPPQNWRGPPMRGPPMPFGRLPPPPGGNMGGQPGNNMRPPMGGPPGNMGGPPSNMGGPPGNMSGPPGNIGGPPGNMGGPPGNIGMPHGNRSGPPGNVSGSTNPGPPRPPPPPPPSY